MSGSGYTGALSWLTGNTGFIYSPSGSGFRIGVGTGATAYTHFSTAAVTVAITTASTSTSTGAVVISTGGLGVAGAIYGGSTLAINGATSAALIAGTSVAIKGAVGGAAVYLTDATGATPGTTSPGLFFASSTDGMVIRNASGALQIIDESAPGAGDGSVRVSISNTGTLTVSGTVIHTLSATPASASATGTTGTLSWDASFIYVCTGTNTWKRAALSTW
jgi:hypothetical protein